MDFKSLRKEYQTAGIEAQDLPEDPISALRQWYQGAVDSCPDSWFEPNAMALATATPDGQVTCRWVLMKGITQTGIRFFTNYGSEKGRQLAANPRAAATFHWPFLGRQIRLEGAIEKTSAAVSDEYFHSRPRGSQIGAVVSVQSQEIQSRQQLEAKQAEFESRFEDQEIPRPENWGGYLLTPTRAEFWQGRLNRLHDRVVFDRVDSDRWIKKRLSP